MIALLAHLREATPRAAGPHLIIVPASLVGNWQAELAAWAPALEVFTYRGPAAQRTAAWLQQVLCSSLPSPLAAACAQVGQPVPVLHLQPSCAALPVGSRGLRPASCPNASPTPKHPVLQVQRGAARFHVALTTYELAMAEADTERLASLQWEYLITDEAHRLKSLRSRLRSQLLRLRFCHLLLLTGALAA